MNIGRIHIGLPKLNPIKENRTKPFANLNEKIQDIFVPSKQISKPSEKEALKYVENLKNSDGNPRFEQKEINDFKISYATGYIDLETIKAFKDTTNFDMKNMKSIYRMAKELNDNKFNEKVSNAIAKLPNNFKPDKFIQNVFEPQKEFSLTNNTESLSYKFDVENSSIISKSTFKTNDKNSIFETIDYKNNTTTSKTLEYDYEKMNYRLLEQKVIKNDKNGKMLREETVKPSEVKGVYDVKYTYANGKTKQISKANIDKKTGIITVKRDMKSENGTRTEFLYENDPQGNRIIDYKITDKDGKILMGSSQTFEVINNNHFISSNNGYKYDIQADNNKLTVKDLHHNKEVSINFNKKIDGNKLQMIDLLKKVSGEELFEAVSNVNKMTGIKDFSNGSFSPVYKNIETGDSLYVFLHELGHAKDAQIQKNTKEIMLNKNKLFTNNKDIQQTYFKERETFNKYHSDEERNHIKYFTQEKGHYQGKLGGLSELVAETNAITHSITDGKIDCLGTRSLYLQQHFPETIAKIKDAMNWKDDISAIEYYGT